MTFGGKIDRIVVEPSTSECNVQPWCDLSAKTKMSPKNGGWKIPFLGGLLVFGGVGFI